MKFSMTYQIAAVIAVAAMSYALWLMRCSYLGHSASPAPDPVRPHHYNRSQICTSLAISIPGGFLSSGDPVFRQTIDQSFASQARDELPECITKPSSAIEVSLIIDTLRKTWQFDSNVKFAIRSGGHFPGSGHSSTRGGVLIDLGSINEVAVSQDQESVIIGTGARWGHVYQTLDRHGLTVAGGRNSDVGVGGLALGGGISFFSPQVGLVCDNILEYEIVLANSTIVRASKTENMDLWRSLKGGSSNFGIVTRFTVETFPSSPVWAGFNYYTYGQVGKLVKAFYEFNNAESSDEFAASPMLSLNYISSPSMKIVCVNAIHTRPERWPSSWKAFKAVWPRWSTNKIQSIAQAAGEFSRNAPPGKRQHYATISVSNDLETLQAIPGLYENSITSIRDIKGVTWTLVLQPLPNSVMDQKSPNVLGLNGRNRSDGNPVIILICPTWQLARDDAVVIAAVRMLLDEISALATERQTADDFVYLNYAGGYQDPFAGYGETNLLFLKEVSRKYDPERFFQRVRNGGFKLGL